MKHYCITYLSEGGIHYQYRCCARSKKEAKKQCREFLGISSNKIVEVVELEWVW